MRADDTDIMYNIFPWECLGRLSHWLYAVHKAIAIIHRLLFNKTNENVIECERCFYRSDFRSGHKTYCLSKSFTN